MIYIVVHIAGITWNRMSSILIITACWYFPSKNYHSIPYWKAKYAVLVQKIQFFCFFFVFFRINQLLAIINDVRRLKTSYGRICNTEMVGFGNPCLLLNTRVPGFILDSNTDFNNSLIVFSFSNLTEDLGSRNTLNVFWNSSHQNEGHSSTDMLRYV